MPFYVVVVVVIVVVVVVPGLGRTCEISRRSHSLQYNQEDSGRREPASPDCNLPLHFSFRLREVKEWNRTKIGICWVGGQVAISG